MEETNPGKANFDLAITYIKDVQNIVTPETYEQFLQIMMSVHQAKDNPISIQEILDRVKALFADQPGLVEGFEKFVPMGSQETATADTSEETAAGDEDDDKSKR